MKAIQLNPQSTFGTTQTAALKATAQRASKFARGWIIITYLLLALVIAGMLTAQHAPKRARLRERGSASGEAVTIKQRVLLMQMQEVVSRMEEVKGTPEFDCLAGQLSELIDQYDSTLR